MMMMMMMMFPKYNQNKTQLKILQKQFFNITLAELRLKSGQKKRDKKSLCQRWDNISTQSHSLCGIKKDISMKFTIFYSVHTEFTIYRMYNPI